MTPEYVAMTAIVDLKSVISGIVAKFGKRVINPYDLVECDSAGILVVILLIMS